jgi:hypothetical protein
VQWLGCQITIFAMSYQHAEYYAWTQIFQGNVMKQKGRAEVIWAILALRSLISSQAKTESARPGGYDQDSTAHPKRFFTFCPEIYFEW